MRSTDDILNPLPALDDGPADDLEDQDLDRGGTGRGTYWRLSAATHNRIAAPGSHNRDLRMDWETAKSRVHSVLRQRTAEGMPELSNAEVRSFTDLDRFQVRKLLDELWQEGLVASSGFGRGARWFLAPPMEQEK